MSPANLWQAHRACRSREAAVFNLQVHVADCHLHCRLLAIMGPSGGGKTSLLNALAGQVPATKGNQLSTNKLSGGGNMLNSVVNIHSAICLLPVRDEAPRRCDCEWSPFSRQQAEDCICAARRHVLCPADSQVTHPPCAMQAWNGQSNGVYGMQRSPQRGFW